MFGAKKINNKLILHVKRENGNNTYVVKPHKSGDVNSYTFEEFNSTCQLKDKKKLTINVISKQSIQSIQSIQPIQSVKSFKPKQLTQSIQPIQPMAHPKIQPANLNTIRRGLLIGINYVGSNNQLNECINNCENLRNFLVMNKYFNSNELMMMTDFTPGIMNPSKSNIMNQLNILLKFARSNPKKQVSLFMSYSGYCIDNAVLCPNDFQNAGCIDDDELRGKFINQLPSNVKLLMLMDACYNKPILNLKYEYKVDEKDTYIVSGKLLSTICDIIVINGYDDNQNDKQNDKQGAIITALLNNYKGTNNYNELIFNIRKWLKENNHKQTPQLVSGKFIDTNDRFLLSSYR